MSIVIVRNCLTSQHIGHSRRIFSLFDRSVQRIDQIVAVTIWRSTKYVHRVPVIFTSRAGEEVQLLLTGRESVWRGKYTKAAKAGGGDSLTWGLTHRAATRGTPQRAADFQVLQNECYAKRWW